MYNEDIKNQYLNQVENSKTRKTATLVLEKFESGLEQELAVLNREEIINRFLSLEYISYKTLRNEIYFINSYISWYNYNVAPVHYSLKKEISFSEIDLKDSVKKKLFVSIDELATSLDQWPANEGYYITPISYLIWYGFNIREILNLKKNDVIISDDKAIVNNPEYRVEIYDKLVIDALKDYSVTRMSYRESKGKWTVYADDMGFFIKNFLEFNSKKFGQRVLPNMVQSKFNDCNRSMGANKKNINSTIITTSGQLYRISQLERSDKDYVSTVRTQYGANSHDLLRLYDAYKRAFDINN